jgi:hypothetical protein
MNNFNYVDKADKNACPPSNGPFKGLFFSAIACIFFWIGIFFLIGWIR